MFSDEIVFGILPALIAILAVVISAWCIVRAFGVVQVLLGLTAILLSGWSIWVIKNIFDGAWPTFLPHIAIAVSCALVSVQLMLARRRRTVNSTEN